MTPKISDAELAIMRVLWHKGRPLSFTEIRTELEATTDWKKSTIQTLITRLRDKGFISGEEHYVTLYSPTVSQETYVQTEGQSFLDKLFDGSAKKLVAALCRGGQLDAQDVDELRTYFETQEAYTAKSALCKGGDDQ